MSRRTTLATLVIAAAALLGSAAHAADWPGWRGPTSDMVAADTDVFADGADVELILTWRVPLGSVYTRESGYSSVSVAHGLAVTMFSDGHNDAVAAYDAATGDEAWRYIVDLTYFGHDGSRSGPISTPYVSEDLVYALGPKGHLVAVSTDAGAERWTRHLVTDYGATEPDYGFATSPLVHGDVLLVQTGAGDGRAVAGLDRHTGELLWQAGKDRVDYQSPALVSISGETQLVYSTKEWIGGIRPETGELLWEYAHGGDGSATGSGAMSPLAVGADRLFLTHKGSSSVLISLYDEAGDVAPEIQWETRAIRSSYGVPLYHDGFLYSYSRRFLTCVDVETGDPMWKSRQPGDGFPIIVDGHLIIATQKGSVHLAKASPEGYSEIAGLKPFNDLIWSPPTFANGSVYLRSFGGIARLDIAPGSGHVAATVGDQNAPGVRGVLARAEAAEDKQAVIDAFMAEQASFPIVEDDGTVWFVYQGSVEQDVSIAGDFLGDRHAEAMTRVHGADLYYYAAAVEPGARLNYRFIVDFETTVLDPLNPRSVPQTMSLYSDRGGESSWSSMPGWRDAAHLSPADPAARGTVETIDAPSGEGATRTLDVYLPRGYSEGDATYPVAYVHWGEPMKTLGLLTTSLDNLIGHSVAPVIVVFVHRTAGGFGEIVWDGRAAYLRSVAEDIVPMIEERYRVQANRNARASVGYGFGGLAALDLALTYPDLFGAVAAQSPMRNTSQDTELRVRVRELRGDAQRDPCGLWLGWGVYDTRSTLEGWSTVTYNEGLSEYFEGSGHDVTGDQ